MTPWTVAYRPPLCMGFPRQEYWSELSFPSPEDLPDPGTKAPSPALGGRFFTTELPGISINQLCCCCWVTSVVSDSARTHRWEPTRLPHPWESPGKNTGVGRHFLLQCMKVKSESEVAQSYPTQGPHGLQPTRLLRPCDFPDKSTSIFKKEIKFQIALKFLGVGCGNKKEHVSH